MIAKILYLYIDLIFDIRGVFIDFGKVGGGYKGLELWQCYWDQEKVEKIKKLVEKEPSIMEKCD